MASKFDKAYNHMFDVAFAFDSDVEIPTNKDVLEALQERLNTLTEYYQSENAMNSPFGEEFDLIESIIN